MIRGLLISGAALSVLCLVLWFRADAATARAETATQTAVETAEALAEAEKDKADLAEQVATEQSRRLDAERRARAEEKKRTAETLEARADYEQLRKRISKATKGNECSDVTAPGRATDSLRAAAERANRVPDS